MSMKRGIAFVVLVVLLIVGFAAPVLATRTPTNGYVDLSGKIKPMSFLAAGGPPLKVEIVYPEDGMTLPPGTYRVLVSAYAKAGILKVELKIDGPEPMGWTDITGNWDGTYYFYDWTVGTDGTYELTARVTDVNGKSKKDSNTVYIGAPPPPDRWAVLIGIADYEGTEWDLWHPDEDAKEMQAELIEFGYPRGHIKLLLNRKATAAAIVDAIAWLSEKEKAGDEVVFMFCGHGFSAPDEEQWDTDVEVDGYDEGLVTYDFYGLPDGWLKIKFEAFDTTRFAMLYGQCHSGGMFDSPGVDLQGDGRVIASACKAEEVAYDYFFLGNTLWGYYFIDDGLLDDNADSMESAHAWAYPRVVAEQPGQHPQLYDNFEGEFYI